MRDVTADAAWMRLALDEARAAAEHGDVPIGSVVVGPAGAELARARNRREQRTDPTAHAEILALREAASGRDDWRLEGCTVYVTLEPCAMCAGSLVLARVARLVYGADDPKAGAVGSLWDIPRDPRLNHRIEVTRGILEEECAGLLRAFFGARREAFGAGPSPVAHPPDRP
ncbi:MAG: tRNA adenosine(34) deaminase TadA [Nitriliruptorales bacterium]